MPKNTSIKKVLVIGSGPIVIGQAAEFDYSGTQACKTLKQEGIEVVLINSNPATIMTDPGVADKVYVEPITIEYVEKIIDKERPDSIIAGMGGQTGLNMAVELYDTGILEKYGVQVIGTSIESIKKGEDRDLFKELMQEIGQPIPPSKIVTNIEEALEFVKEIGYPVVVRPAYTLGGTGGGIVENEEALIETTNHGLHLSRVGQVLLEKSIKGWKEIEYEVIRDSYGNKIVVCNMENIDPVGIHTGDSIVVAPTQTLSARECAIMRKASMDILEAVGIEGGCNVQLAMSPTSFEYVVIEINPRVSRSSALASKATGYPIAKVATRVALGYALDEINNDLTGKTKACNEPSIDYVVVKIPKWPFDKFRHATRTLGTKMMATGEVMAIGNTFESAFLKAVRSLEIKQFDLIHQVSANRTIAELKSRVGIPDDERLFDLAEMLRRNYRVEMICKLTGMDEFFINKIKGIVDYEEELRAITFEEISAEFLRKIKKKGFSDKAIAQLIKCSPNDIYELRKMFKIKPVYKMVDTCSGEVDPLPAYFYSTYDEEDEVEVSDKKKVIVIGSGPIRIGQGVEFDYCSVHGVKALKKQGIETIIINNNPETVSTDFDIADKLYFEPLTEEDVLNIIDKENPYGVILQFGGQTAIKLAKFLKEKNVNILGTSPDAIDEAEDRERFEALLEKYNIRRPQGIGVTNVEDGLNFAKEVGFPVLVRPSYVLGGQGMEITYNEEELVKYLQSAFAKEKNHTVLVDRYVMGREIEVDAICDGEDILIPGIMEHLERAGVHSGDSISIYPTVNVTPEMKEELKIITEKVAKELKVIGMINIQFIESKGEIYIIEVNPRSSRTIPYISKVTGIPIIEIATRVVLGEKLKDMEYGTGLYKELNKFAVKVPVFSTQKLPNVEVSLGPEMRSTGEVLGVGATLEEALFKGFLASGNLIPKKGGTIMATLRSKDQEEFSHMAKELHDLGYKFMATEGTAHKLKEKGVEVQIVSKIKESEENILTKLRSGQVDMVINTPTKANDSRHDGFTIRRVAIECNIPTITSLDTLDGIVKILKSNIEITNTDIYDITHIAD